MHCSAACLEIIQLLEQDWREIRNIHGYIRRVQEITAGCFDLNGSHASLRFLSTRLPNRKWLVNQDIGIWMLRTYEIALIFPLSQWHEIDRPVHIPPTQSRGCDLWIIEESELRLLMHCNRESLLIGQTEWDESGGWIEYPPSQVCDSDILQLHIFDVRLNPFSRTGRTKPLGVCIQLQWHSSHPNRQSANVARPSRYQCLLWCQAGQLCEKVHSGIEKFFCFDFGFWSATNLLVCRPQDIQLCGSRSGPVNQTILHYSPGIEFCFIFQINLKYNLISGEFSILQGLFAREFLS
jgi:hypothetical protein